MSIHAYVCMTPHGGLIPSTIRRTEDESWKELRASVTEPDTLIDKGWTVQRLECVLVQVEAALDPPV
jgi:hypothetical protein